MIASFPELLTDRRSRRAALGAFTSYDLETGTAVLAAAQEAGVPVILLVSREAFAAPGGDQLLAALVAVADTSGVPCCVQLDHVGDLELMERALRLGCGAVMADGSRLPFDENRELVRRAVALATAHGAYVEAELGHVAGGEDVAERAHSGQLTDPDEAARFAADTDAACLAVSVGNVHGTYAPPPQLDWARLDAVRDATPLPLSLHGASGIPDEDLRRAISIGVAKVNVNTELRDAYLAASERHMHEALDGSRLLGLHERQREAVSGVAARKLALYNGTGA
ncbi:MAG TPA: class II fructose-bisphosphate aldolase [Solirubrobacteraceae bacterium]